LCAMTGSSSSAFCNIPYNDTIIVSVDATHSKLEHRSFSCNNYEFGDPDPGNKKVCSRFDPNQHPNRDECFADLNLMAHEYDTNVDILTGRPTLVVYTSYAEYDNYCRQEALPTSVKVPAGLFECKGSETACYILHTGTTFGPRDPTPCPPDTWSDTTQATSGAVCNVCPDYTGHPNYGSTSASDCRLNSDGIKLILGIFFPVFHIAYALIRW
jgi:hypothetical protein